VANNRCDLVCRHLRGEPPVRSKIVALYYDHEIREKRKVDLRRFATDPPDNPISPKGVAKQLGVSADHLKQLCPDSYEKIRRHWVAYRTSKFKKRQSDIDDRIIQATDQLHAEGVYPSFQRVQARLARMSWLGREHGRNVLRKTQAELGYRPAPGF